MTEEEWLESLKGPSGEQGDPGVGWTVGSGAPAGAGKKGELYLDRERLDVYYYGEEGWEYLANLKGEEPKDLGFHTFNGEDYVLVTWPGEGEEDPTKLYEITITSKEDVSFFVVNTRLCENDSLAQGQVFDTFTSKIRDEKKGITTNTAVLYAYEDSGKGAEQPYSMAIARKQNEARPTEIHVQMREYDPQKQVLRADGEWHTVPVPVPSWRDHVYPLAMKVDPALRGKRVRATALALIPENAEEVSRKWSIYSKFTAYSGAAITGITGSNVLRSSESSLAVVHFDQENFVNLFFEIPEDCTEISFTGTTMGSYRVVDPEATSFDTYFGYFAQVKIEEVEPIREKKMKDEAGSGTQEDPFTPANLEGVWEIEIPADSTVYIGTEITEDNTRFRFINGDYDGLMISSRDFKTSRGQSYSPSLGMEAGTQAVLYPLKGSAGIEITNREDEAITITLTIERLN